MIFWTVAGLVRLDSIAAGGIASMSHIKTLEYAEEHNKRSYTPLGSDRSSFAITALALGCA